MEPKLVLKKVVEHLKETKINFSRSKLISTTLLRTKIGFILPEDLHISHNVTY